MSWPAMISPQAGSEPLLDQGSSGCRLRSRTFVRCRCIRRPRSRLSHPIATVGPPSASVLYRSSPLSRPACTSRRASLSRARCIHLPGRRSFPSRLQSTPTRRDSLSSRSPEAIGRLPGLQERLERSAEGIFSRTRPLDCRPLHSEFSQICARVGNISPGGIRITGDRDDFPVVSLSLGFITGLFGGRRCAHIGAQPVRFLL